jgi:hypothetical protein
MAIKTCVAVQLVVYDSQASNRNQGGLTVRAPPHSTPNGCLEVIYVSQLAEYTKVPKQTGGSSYFLIEKSPKTAFYIKTFNKI